MASDDYSGSYTWNLSEYLDLEPKQRKTADTFTIGTLPFTLEAYPNGDHDSNVGSFMLYCTSLSIPDNYAQIILNLRLYCKQTNSSFTSIAILTSQRNSAGWSSETMKLDELKPFHTLTIGCSLNILKIIGSDNGNIIYKNISNQSSLQSLYSSEWTIDSQLMQAFKNCRVGKSFESEIFDNLFCLRCLPNGKRANDEGNVKLYLILCGMPSSDNDSVHILYTLWCNETNTGYNSKIVLNYEYNSVGWPNQILLTSQIKDLSQLTFNAEIEIISDKNTIANDSSEDSSTYSSDSSMFGVKGVISVDAYEEELEQKQTETINDIVPDDTKVDNLAPNELSPPQITTADLVTDANNSYGIVVDTVDNGTDTLDIDAESTPLAMDKSPAPAPPTPDPDTKEEINEEQKGLFSEDKPSMKKKRGHVHKHHKNKKRLTLNAFKSVSLEDLIENDVDILDNYDIAKKICKFFDKQFDDTDTVCMVSERHKQPTLSYWVKGDYVRKHANIHGKHVLVYRASKHTQAKEPIVSKQAFEDCVRKLSNESSSVNSIADKLDDRFGIGCHYARSSTKSPQYDIYCRFSDKYECGFKLPSGAYIIAWRR